jgi:bacteriorhodopsin
MGKLSGLLSHSLHACVMVGFAVFLANNKRRTSAASRTLSIGEIDPSVKEEAELAMLRESSQISLLFSAVFFFFVAIYIMNAVLESDLNIVQRSVMKKRLEYCMFINLYICFFSCLFNLVQFGDEDDVPLTWAESRDEAVLDLGRPIEWILTCPLMQLCLPIFGGEKVPDFRRTSMPVNAFVALNLAMGAMLQADILSKLGFFMAGLGAFCVLIYQMNRCIVDSSGGQENMLRGKSPMRTIVLITAATWVPFPIWYALSPEGFNVIKNTAGMRIAVAFLNVFSKGAFIFYLNRVREDLVTKEKALLEVKELSQHKANDANGEEQTLSQKLSIIIAQVLLSMGRSSDLDMLKEILERNMIYTNEDVMVLTEHYCDSIGLPWSFVFATKQKIRATKVEQGDAWSISKDAKDSNIGEPPLFDLVSPVPLPPQVANDPRKLREVQRRRNQEGKYQEDGFGFSTASTVPAIGNTPTSTTIPAYSTSASVPQINFEGGFGGTSGSVPQITVEAGDQLAADRDNISKIHNALMEELQAMRVQAKLDKERKDQDMVALSEKVTDNVNRMMEQMMGEVNNVLADRLKEPNRDASAKRASSGVGRPRGA